MIGWFSLNVPSGLGLYWLTNNVVTTASTLAIRSTVNTDLAVPAAAKPAAEPKSQGFGRRYGEVISSTETDGTMVTITPPTRAERRATGGDGGVIEAVATPVAEAGAVATAAAPAVATMPEADGGVSKSAAKKKKKGKGKKAK